jgi:hypothetical protein
LNFWAKLQKVPKLSAEKIYGEAWICVENKPQCPRSQSKCTTTLPEELDKTR